MRSSSTERRYTALVAITTFLAIAGTIVAFIAVDDAQQSRVESAFARDVEHQRIALTGSLAVDLADVESVHSFYAASTFVSREEFSIFTAEALESHSSISSLMWFPRVLRNDREAFEQGVRQEGFPGFVISDWFESGTAVPAPDRDWYFPAAYVESTGRFPVPLGVDAATVPELAGLLTSEFDGREMAASPALPVRARPRLSGDVFVLRPVFETDSGDGTGPGVLQGFIAATLVVPGIVEEALITTVDGEPVVHLMLQAPGVGLRPVTLYRSTGFRGTDSLRSVLAIDVAGQQWLATMTSNVSYATWWDSSKKWQVLVLGLVATLALTAFLVRLVRHSAAAAGLASMSVTAREQAERELGEREQQFKAVVENMVGGVAVSRPGWGELLFMNQAYLDLFGYRSLDEFPGSLADRVHPDDIDAIKQSDAQPDAYPGPIRFRVRVPGHQERIASSTTTVVMFAGQLANLMVTRDITDEEAAVQTLADSQARYARLSHEYELILRSAANGILALDEGGIITGGNPAAADLLGVSESEMIGTRARDRIRVLNPDGSERPAGEGFTNTVHATGEAIHIPHLIFERHDGSRVSVEAVGSPIRDYNADISGVVISISDITERVKVERMKDEFVSTVSHELRTPLTAIRAAVELTASGGVGELPPKAQRMMDIAAENSVRLTRLINDVLDIERLENGTLDVRIEECDAELLMNQAVLAVDALARESAVEVVVKATDIKFASAPDRVVQVLTNLVGNAIKFSPAGSTVNVAAEADGDQVRFKVADRGRGIADDRIESIFDRFEQVDSSDSTVGNGAGLGLAISQGIVTELGGIIWVESSPGVGSTFTFLLPTRDEAQSPRPKGKAQNESI